jgi:hypothetical protein
VQFRLPLTSRFLSLLLTAGLAAGAQAWASDDEMSTETKPGTTVKPHEPLVKDTTLSGPQAKPAKPLDPALRAKIRKKAPFWIDDTTHGAPIRINKDGTFSSEAQGGGAIAGSWKTFKNELNISWSDGADQYSYPVSFGKSGLLIKGHSIKKNRYRLSGE